MGCPNCSKEKAITLSICPSCGAMVNDSVREELATKITPRKISEPPKIKHNKRGTDSVPKSANQIKLKPSPKSISTKPKTTAELKIRKDTNPTLVEFQTEQAQLPEWRLHIQNAAKQRITRNTHMSSVPSSGGGQAIAVATARAPVSLGSTALKAEVIEKPDNSHVANALKRIQASRSKYLVSDPIAVPAQKNEEREHPLTIASRTENPQPDTETHKSSVNFPVKPTLVPKVGEHGKSLYDTNELDPEFAQAKAKVSSSFDKSSSPTHAKSSATQKEGIADKDNSDLRQIDDFAPFALRFNSAVFDLIIGTFFSLVLLSPLMLFGGNWFTFAGFLGFIAVTAIVMFIYLTAAIGYAGKTFGMHLFKLEMIDIDGDLYPTYHQAAVSSAVFLLSTAFGGIGFLTSLIDEENRAAHDLASGTIIVKEL